ncbi:MAG: N-acetylmuramoyl-L-alanine amidase [Bacteroidales bacterium]|nr:N-acetylmuramoyl-L-alanine amidase [Bacteroidales bacterium]
MMRKFLLFITLILSGLTLQGQTAQEFKSVTDTLRARLHRRTSVDASLKLNQVMKRGTTLNFIFSKELGDYPWRTNDKEWFEEQLRALMPNAYRSYKVGDILVEKDTLDNLLMPPLTATGKPASTRFRRSDPRSKTIPLVRTEEQWNKGLSGRHIALWQSHGRYYEAKTERWEWQRAATHRTVEDLYTQSYVLPFLMPMLENAGAVVMTPRERDIQSWEIICDNDPSFTGRRTGKTRLTGRYKETGEWSEIAPGFADTKAVWREYENPFLEGTARMCETSTEKDPEQKAFANWYPNFPEGGEYAVYVSYRSFANSTTDAVYTVHHLGGESVFHVNQQMGGGTWVYLGTFPFAKGMDGFVRLSNQSTSAGVISADAVKFGGGMGKVERGGELSGLPAYLEGALYSMQWYGIDTHLFDDWEDDYTKDYAGRGKWATEMTGGSRVNPNVSGRKIPFDLTLAFHSDAGTTPNDTIIGTLGIYTRLSDNKDVLPNGESRMNGRLLTDFVQTQVVNDIRKQFDANWTRRALWDRSYSESRTTSVPAMLLELLSHQNFADMKYGLDPAFRFTVSRSVYKGILKYLSARYGCSYAVQPLPIKSFAAEVRDGKAILSWEETKDPDEPTAAPSGFILYTREGDGAFDNGVRLEDVQKDGDRYSVSVPIHKGKLYSYRIVAFNDGGKSFPSETLAVGYSGNDAKKILVVNNFTRISAPAWFDTPSYGGFMDNIDSGVPYVRDILFIGEVNQFDRTKKWTDDDNPGFGGSNTNRAGRLVAGNTFDYPAAHGRILLGNGYTVCSVSADAFLAMDASEYAAVDLICGKQVTTKIGRGAVPDRYTVFPAEMQEALRKYASAGGSILVAGSYIGTDAWDQIYPGTFPIKGADKTRSFIQDVLGYKWVTNFGDVSGIIVPKKGAPVQLSDPMKYNRLFDEHIYRVENPDGIEPAGPHAQTFLRYAGTDIPAATVFDNGKHKVIACGFPLEALTTEGALESLLLVSMIYLVQ